MDSSFNALRFFNCTYYSFKYDFIESGIHIQTTWNCGWCLLRAVNIISFTVLNNFPIPPHKHFQSGKFLNGLGRCTQGALYTALEVTGNICLNYLLISFYGLGYNYKCASFPLIHWDLLAEIEIFNTGLLGLYITLDPELCLLKLLKSL